MNLYRRSLTIVILISVVVHMAILGVYALWVRDYTYLNIYNILDIDLLMPGVEQGVFSMVSSWIIIAVIWAGIVLWLKRKGK